MNHYAHEKDIITDFHLGKEKASHHLYNLHFPSLCYFADRMIDDKHEAEDIVVDTFMKLLNKKADFDNLSDIKSFLYTATSNACLDSLRKRKRQESVHREIKYLLAEDENVGIDEMIIAKVLQTIHIEIEGLPTQCRKIFKSIFLENKSTSKIAIEMKISPQTVLNQKSKALRLLRLKLYKDGLFIAFVFLQYKVWS